MKSLLITMAIATTAVMLEACPDSRPIPSPRSAPARSAASAVRLVGAQRAVTIARGWACSTAVSAGDSSTRCLRAETREVDGMNSGKPSGGHPMATLSRAAGTPAEGAETT
jgi:hypothetical protein